jgi:hypothetical protein
LIWKFPPIVVSRPEPLIFTAAAAKAFTVVAVAFRKFTVVAVVANVIGDVPLKLIVVAFANVAVVLLNVTVPVEPPMPSVVAAVKRLPVVGVVKMFPVDAVVERVPPFAATLPKAVTLPPVLTEKTLAAAEVSMLSGSADWDATITSCRFRSVVVSFVMLTLLVPGVAVPIPTLSPIPVSRTTVPSSVQPEVAPVEVAFQVVPS